MNQPPKFKVGDKVDFTNDYGVFFPNKTITGIEYWDSSPEPRYYYEPSDSPWFASRESHFALTPEPTARVVEDWS